MVGELKGTGRKTCISISSLSILNGATSTVKIFYIIECELCANN